MCQNLNNLTDISSKEFHAILKNTAPNIPDLIEMKFTDGIIVGDRQPPARNADLIFRKCCFSQNFVVKPIFSNNIVFEDCVFQADVILEADCKEKIHFRRGKIEGTLVIKAGDYNKLEIACDCSGLEIETGKFTNLNISPIFGDKFPGEMTKIELNCQHLSGNIKIENLKVKTEILCKGTVNKDAEIIFNRLTFKQFNILNVLNNGKIKLNELKPIDASKSESSFNITNSNMGKAEFVLLDFRSLHKVTLSSVNLIDSIFINVIWPEKLYIEPDSNDVHSLLDQKESYRQLKYSYSRQGDSVLEHKFHSLEMNTYRAFLHLKRSKAIEKNWYQRWQIDRQTSLILWFSSWSSDYGQSIKRPLVIWLVAGLILFPVMAYFGFIKGIVPGLRFHFSLAAISKTFGHFLNLLNPLRRYDTVEINAGLALDFTMRIVASSCIYNFIRASRRFVK